MIKIKANKELFDEIKILSSRVNCLNNIVQNDMEIEETELLGWIREAQIVQIQLSKWLKKVVAHIKKEEE